MPFSCFSYPPPAGQRDAAPPGLRQLPVTSSCFRYLPDVPPGARQMPGTHCFSYPATWCFRYPSDVAGTPDRDAAPPASSGPRQMPFGTCFRY
jgi:hypothetical protein